MLQISREEIDKALKRMRDKRLIGTTSPTGSDSIELHTPVYSEPVIVQRSSFEVFQRCGIPKRYYEMDFAWLRANGTIPAEDRNSYKAVFEYAENLDAHLRDGKGVILKGPAGNGKTSLAVCILKRAIAGGIRCYMISMPSLLDTMLSLSKGPQDVYLKFEREIRTVPILVLDDFGAEYDNKWVVNKVNSIITDRYNCMRPVIITSNLSKEELESGYSRPIYDRLRGEYYTYNFRGPSHRGTGREN